MAVVLFKNGESKLFDEFTFRDRLREGWSLTNINPPVLAGGFKLVQPAPEPVKKKRRRKKKGGVNA